MGTFAIRHASDDKDFATIVDLWNDARAWLRDRGSDQWQYPVRTSTIQRHMEDRTIWIVESDDVPVATVTLNDDADPRLWRGGDDPEDGLYVHRLVVSRHAPISGLGAAILHWCGTKATAEGKHWLRLDAWTTNTDLHRYYLDHGFRLVRLVTGPDIVSGALFERPAVHSADLEHTVSEEVDQP